MAICHKVVTGSSLFPRSEGNGTELYPVSVTDYGVKKNVENLPQLRQRMSEIIDHYHDAQQDILETFIARGQLQKLAEPTTLTNEGASQALSSITLGNWR